MDAVRGTLAFDSPEGKAYRLGERPAQLVVRPRGWHLIESHVLVDGVPISASLFDAGLYLFHNAAERVARGSGPYLYLPKLESHHEARLWNEVFVHAQAALGVPRGSVRATVLIETIIAAFEMDEILYELREHAAGPERRPLGLPVQRHQAVPRRPGARVARSLAADDDRAVHARLHASCSSGRATAAARTRSAAWRRSSRTAATPRSPSARWPRSARTRSASAATGSTARGSPIPTSCPIATEIFDSRARRPRRTRRTGRRDDVAVGARRAARLRGRRRRGHRGRHPGERPRRARLPRLRGCAAPARPRSTTSWRTPRPPRSRARSSGSGAPAGHAVGRSATRRSATRSWPGSAASATGRLADAGTSWTASSSTTTFAEFLTLRGVRAARRRAASGSDRRRQASARRSGRAPRTGRSRAGRRSPPSRMTIGAADEDDADRARDRQALVRRVVARVVEVGGPDRPARRRVEEHEVGVLADLDRTLVGQPERARRGRREQVDHPLDGDPAASRRPRCRASVSSVSMPGAPLLIRSNETPDAGLGLLDGQPVGHVVGGDEVERAVGQPGPQRVAIGGRAQRRRDDEARAAGRVGLVVARRR